MYLSTASITGLMFIVLVTMLPRNLETYRIALVLGALALYGATMPLRKALAIALNYFNQRRGRISVVLATRHHAPHARGPGKASRGPLGGAAAHWVWGFDFGIAASSTRSGEDATKRDQLQVKPERGRAPICAVRDFARGQEPLGASSEAVGARATSHDKLVLRTVRQRGDQAA